MLEICIILNANVQHLVPLAHSMGTSNILNKTAIINLIIIQNISVDILVVRVHIGSLERRRDRLNHLVFLCLVFTCSM